MRGAWGKPYGTVARVDIGQILLSVRCKDSNAHVIQEALRRARYKFPGRQKIIVSKKWGFTNVNREQYLKLKEDKRVVQCVHYPFLPQEPYVLTTNQGRSLCAIHSTQRPTGGQSSCPAEGMSSSPPVCISMYLSEFHHGLHRCRVSLSVILFSPHIHYDILSPMDVGQGKRGVHRVLVPNSNNFVRVLKYLRYLRPH